MGSISGAYFYVTEHKKKTLPDIYNMDIAVINRDGGAHQRGLFLFVAAEYILEHCSGWK